MTSQTPPTDHADVATGDVVLEARDLVKDFRGRRVGMRRQNFRAVDGVSLKLRAGEVTALVGQSGSGKSTVGRMLAQLMPQTSGEILLRDESVAATRGRRFIEYTSTVQLILQDPFASLNPVHRISHSLERALTIHGHASGTDDIEAKSLELLRKMNLDQPERYLHRFPHELSGGERQRISIARALAAQPNVLLADEPVSMLDVTVRKEILDLLANLGRTENLAILYITHDLGSARTYSDETSVMYDGEVVEQGPSDEVINNPQHEYTQRLLAAAPNPRRRLDGESKGGGRK